MRITTLARRSVATLAATALLTTGLTGLSMGTANAQTVTGTPQSVSKVPAGPAINNAQSQFTITGTDFYPADQMDVTLHPTFVASGQGDLNQDNGLVTVDSVAGCAPAGGVTGLPPAPNTSCPGPVTFTADLRVAAPGVYDVEVHRSPSTVGGSEDRDTCFSCLQIFSAGPATVSSVAQDGTSNGNLIITGTNFAHGASVVWFNTDASGAATTPDNSLHFTAFPQYTATTIKGAYTADSGASGRKVLRVFNLDDVQGPGPGATFVQPRVASISPTSLGQGASNIPVTATGSGFDANTTAYWSDPNVTVPGPLVVNSNGTGLGIPTSVAESTVVGTKSLTLKGTGGAYTTAINALTVTNRPDVTSVVQTQRGQNSSSTVTVNGTGFNLGTVFDFGDGTTATTLDTTTATAAQVLLTVQSEATPGPRNVRATNTDHGTDLLTNAYQIVLKPVITSVTPPSGGPGKTDIPITIQGSNFSTSGVTLALSGTGVTVGPINVDPSGTSLTTTFSTASNAPPGPRDITITNTSSAGRSTCAGCWGVNSLSIDQPAGTLNNAVRQLKFSGAGLDPATTVVTLTIPGSQTYQSPLVGSNVACAVPAAGTLCANFDFVNRAGHGVAAGNYTATAVTGSSTITCTSCFPVSASAAPVVTSLANATGTTPAFGGQGARDRSVTIAGSNFAPGEIVTFTGTGITTKSVTWDSPTQLTAIYDIAGNAPVGPRGLRVANPAPDNSGGDSASNAFTVNAGPATTATNTPKLGQNATWDVTLAGSNYAATAVADFGPDVTSVTKTVSATSLVVTVTVADTAATAPLRDIRVTNTADGGSSVLAGAFQVTPAPRITTLSPAVAKAGEKPIVTLTGSGFNINPPPAPGTTTAFTCPTPANGSCPTLTVAGVVPTVKTVSADGTTMTAEFAVNPGAPISNPSVKVINPDHGQSIKTAGFRVATVPVAPINVAVPTSRDHGVTVTWAFPTTTNADGGSPLTQFVVDDGDATTSNAVVVDPAIRTADLTGLVNGQLYTFTVTAVNAVGSSAPGTKQARAGSQTPTTLTSTRSPHTGVAGNGVTYSGKLTRTSNGAPIAGARIRLTLTPDFGAVRGQTLATNSAGVWSYRFVAPLYNTTVRASFAGTATDMPADAATYKMGVAPRIVRRAPGSGYSSPAPVTISISGFVTPNKAGQLLTLKEGTTVVGAVRIASDGTYLFRSRLPKGTHTLRMYMAATPGNVAGASASFVLYRT